MDKVDKYLKEEENTKLKIVRQEFLKFDRDWTPKMDTAIDKKSAKEIDGYMNKIDQILSKISRS